MSLDIQSALREMADPGYAAFQHGLMPTVDPDRILGVRMPALRRYARTLRGSAAAREFLRDPAHEYYDENNLHALLLAQCSDFDETLAEVERFLPYVDNWATCDLLSPQALLQAPERLWACIARWLQSAHPYTVRFGLVRLTAWYLTEPRFSPSVLTLAASVHRDDYYIRMAQAWLFSMALVHQYSASLPYLTEGKLDAWVHNKAIQKAVESRQLLPEIKSYLKTLKCPTKGEHS